MGEWKECRGLLSPAATGLSYRGGYVRLFQSGLFALHAGFGNELVKFCH
jgi:hypothetical protein